MDSAGPDRVGELEARLAEAEELLDAIRMGEIDAVVVGDADERQVFTLKSADRPYRLLIEQMGEGALTLGTDGVILYCNQAFADLVGTSTSQILGSRVQRFVLEARDPLAPLIRDGGRTEIVLATAAGGRPARLTLAPLPTDDGQLVCGVVTDLTDTRAQADELADTQERLAQAVARRMSDERYRLILESATDYAIISTDLDGCVTIWNTGACNILGWSAEDIVGRALPMIWTPEDRAAGEPEAEMSQALARGRAEDERFHLRKDGSRFWANGLMMPLRADDGTENTDGSVIGFLKILRDRTVERAAATAAREFSATLERLVNERTAELAAANDRLQIEMAERARSEEALRHSQKLEAIGQLTGGVAHDFNNLLTIIRSSVDLLRRHELPEDRKRRYIDAISDTADRAAKLTGQLLAYARRQPLRPEAFDVAARLRDTADMLGTTVGPSITIATEIHCDICYVQADANQFETALLNMAVNARDAMDGEGVLTISVDPTATIPGEDMPNDGARGFVAVTVTDTGSGILVERLERIFEPFYTTKGVGKGTGLGLSQVYGFAKQSGGEIRVDSRVGRGTAFTLYLPRVALPPPTTEEAYPPQGPGQAQGRILLVEDNPQVGDLAAQLLEDLGYTIVRADNAASALALVRGGQGFDVVFSDVVMPGAMSGVDLAHELKRTRPDLPVVLTTGYSEALAEGAVEGVELLRKPYSVEALSRIIRRVSRQRAVG